MPDGHVIEFDRVTKRFGDVAAVTDFSGRVEPGVVTGFLGPNGAGKTTTLRMLLGQIDPTSGSARIGGALYDDLKHPARVIAAMPENPVFRPRRTVERHLTVTAKSHGIPLSRVGEIISFVGLGSEAGARIGTLSLGMRQRLSAATALLGDPSVLVLDEPANGLDPEGIRWMRMLIRGLADEGRTVLVSSHVLSEVEQVADDILIIARGRLKFAGSLATLADPTAGPVIVDAADRDALSDALADAGYGFEVLRSGLTVRGSDAARIGEVAAAAGVALTTLQQRGPSLEDVFVDLVNDRPVRLRKPEDDADAAGAGAAETVASDAAGDVPVEDAAPGEAGETAEVVEAAAEAAPAENVDAAADAAPVALDEPVDEDSALDADEPVTAPDEAVDTDHTAPDTGTDHAEPDTGTDHAEPEHSGIEIFDADHATDDAEHAEAGEGDDAETTAEIEPAEERVLPGLSDLAAAAAGVLGRPAVDDDADENGSIIDEVPLAASADEDDAQSDQDDDAEAAEPEASGTEASADETGPSWSPVPAWLPKSATEEDEQPR